MTREKVNEAVQVMLAWAEGKKVQCKSWLVSDFTDVDEPAFDWGSYDYRIKPEPKYRPFQSYEECFEEMMKHDNPGWVTNGSGYFQVTGIIKNGIYIDNDGITYEEAFEQFCFIDTECPFGMKEDDV